MKTYDASPKRMNIIFQWQTDNLADLIAATHKEDIAYYLGFRSAMECVIEALRGDFEDELKCDQCGKYHSTGVQTDSGIICMECDGTHHNTPGEGMDGFIGPSLNNWHWTTKERNAEFDYRCRTGADRYTWQLERTYGNYKDDLDAPESIPAGSHIAVRETYEQQNERNIFPQTTMRGF